MSTSIPVNKKNAEAISDAAGAISKYVEELEKRIARARTFEHEQALAIEFLSAFAHLEQVPEHEWESPKLRVCLSLDPGTVDALMINVDATKLSDVVEPLRWLSARLGKYDIDDFPELGRRAYVFANGGRTLRFQVFFNGDKSVCRFVQTGVKEEPVFKLMCDGSEVSE